MGRPRIVEVARAAGVSRATAARVRSGATNVDPTMAAAVEIAAKELGYEANSAARAARRAPSASSSPSASSTA